MSLINQMLKDLEHRSKRTRNSVDSLSGLIPSSLYSLRNARNNIFFILVAVMLSSLIVFLIYQLHNTHKKEELHQTLYPLKLPSMAQENIKDSHTGVLFDMHSTATAVTG